MPSTPQSFISRVTQHTVPAASSSLSAGSFSPLLPPPRALTVLPHPLIAEQFVSFAAPRQKMWVKASLDRTGSVFEARVTALHQRGHVFSMARRCVLQISAHTISSSSSSADASIAQIPPSRLVSFISAGKEVANSVPLSSVNTVYSAALNYDSSAFSSERMLNSAALQSLDDSTLNTLKQHAHTDPSAYMNADANTGEYSATLVSGVVPVAYFSYSSQLQSLGSPSSESAESPQASEAALTPAHSPYNRLRLMRLGYWRTPRYSPSLRLGLPLTPFIQFTPLSATLKFLRFNLPSVDCAYALAQTALGILEKTQQKALHTLKHLHCLKHRQHTHSQ